MNYITVIPYVGRTLKLEIYIQFVLRSHSDLISVYNDKIIYYNRKDDNDNDITEFVSDLSEEQYFMHSLTWNFPIPYDACIAIVHKGREYLKRNGTVFSYKQAVQIMY